MSTRAVTDSAASTSKVLYAYRHVSTNQVLYSLTQDLKNLALKQLPDLGANRTPSAIRRDLWRPFFKVHFGALRSARGVYDKLLQWRKLHETQWKAPPELALNYTKEQIQFIKEDMMNNRGGSKQETAYDLIKRHKRAMKARIIMDQKANSVADLAAVLLEQEGVQKSRFESYHKREYELMEQLATEAKTTTRLQDLEREIEEVKTTIAGQSWEDTPEIARLKTDIRGLEARQRIVQRRGHGQAPKEQLDQARAQLQELRPYTKAGLERRRAGLETQRAALQFAVNAVEEYTKQRTSRSEELEKARAELKQAEEEYDSSSAELTRKLADSSSAARKASWRDTLFGKNASKKLDAEAEAHRNLEKQKQELEQRLKNKRSRVKELEYLSNKPPPRFPAELRPRELSEQPPDRPLTAGPVKVVWEHKADMAFARSWPERIEHVEGRHAIRSWQQTIRPRGGRKRRRPDNLPRRRKPRQIQDHVRGSEEVSKAKSKAKRSAEPETPLEKPVVA